jgi:hypothetical protein
MKGEKAVANYDEELSSRWRLPRGWRVYGGLIGGRYRGFILRRRRCRIRRFDCWDVSAALGLDEKVRSADFSGG